MGKAERTIQDACMEYLGMHPKVAFVHTTTTGRFCLKGGRYMKVGYPGMGDIIGMLTDGRFLSVEVKQPGTVPTPDQEAFIDMVAVHGGLSCWTDSIEDLIKIMADEYPGH